MVVSIKYSTIEKKEATCIILPFDYIGYKRLSENKRFPNPKKAFR
jgi:hypothetical protein